MGKISRPDTDPALGLTQAEAEARLRTDGPNELPEQARFDWARRLGEPFREPAYQLLLGAGLVYLALGDRLEGGLLFIAAVMAVGISIAQDYRTERTLIRLRNLSSPRALVRRDGAARRIPARELVEGDIVVLNEGDRTPADGHILAAHGLAADESLMTGESMPVDKVSRNVTDSDTEASFAIGGSVVVKGDGVICVTATGPRSQLGRIGVAIAGTSFEPPRLTVQMRRLVRLFAVLAVGASLLLVLVAGMRDGQWLGALLLGLALAISLVPEEIPLVTAAFTVVGALRIARAGVLARQAGAIETLGEMTVLCVDKTGTLTWNRMAVAELWTPNGGACDADGELDGAAAALVRAGADACAPAAADPMELAILHAAGTAGETRNPVRTWPFERGAMAMANLYGDRAGALPLVLKGAPETVIPWAEPDGNLRRRALKAAQTMAERGIRVIAVAEGAAPPAEEELADLSVRLIGLIGLADPLRPEAPDLIAQCEAAGIRVVMMTGDHAVTAAAIAGQAGIRNSEEVIEGHVFAAMEEDERVAACHSASVFARVVPEQKLAIVTALKEAGQIVAMTGDGVNDAPALKAAHIGVAMGERGSDVAREAAALVLVRDDLASLVKAIRLGRRIGDNIRKALAYIFSVHVMIAGAALAPVLYGLPPLLLPLHVVLLEFVIDPVCAIVLEADAAEPGVMRRPPRRPEQPLFGLADIVVNVILGATALAGILAAYWWTSARSDAETARATAFLAIMVMNAVLILITRIRRGRIGALGRPGNRFLLPAAGAVLALAVTVTHVPFLMSALDFAPPRLDVAAGSVAASTLLLLAWEVGLRRLYGGKSP